jgi:ribonuclease P protein component
MVKVKIPRSAFSAQGGKTTHAKHFSLRILPSSAEDIVCAPVVSKNVAKKAVDRNKLKRQMREALRTATNNEVSPRCYILYAKKGAAEISFDEIKHEVRELLS